MCKLGTHAFRVTPEPRVFSLWNSKNRNVATSVLYKVRILPTALQIPYMDYSRLANQLPSLKFPWTPLSGSRSVLSDSLRPHGLYNPWNSPGQNTGVGSLSLLQGIFPIQGSNPGLPHCRRIIYQLSHNRSPRILEWVAYPFSRGSSWPRNWTGVSCFAGGFSTNWAVREPLKFHPKSWMKRDLRALLLISLPVDLTIKLCFPKS